MSIAPQISIDPPDYVRLHRFSTADYLQMIEKGILGPHDKVELIHGLIIEKDEPDRAPHRFSTAAYLEMIENGVLGPEDHVELVGGVILEVLIIHREPEADRYASIETWQGDDIVSPLAAPELSFAVRQAFN